MLHSDQGFQSLNIKGRNVTTKKMQEARLLHRFGNQNHGKSHNSRSLRDVLPCFGNSSSFGKETYFIVLIIQTTLIRKHTSLIG